ncbi:MAG: restriction endonuclease [Clostridiales bacterium]
MAKRRKRFKLFGYRRTKIKEKEILSVIGIAALFLFIVSKKISVKTGIDFSNMVDYLYIFIVISIIGLIIFLVSKPYIQRKFSLQRVELANTINDLLNIYKNKPTDFEKYIADLYRMLGYSAKVTKAVGDCGKDVILKKNSKKFVVEVKLYSRKNSIGRPMIQKLHSAFIDEKADGGIFVTTSYFTNAAIDFAKNKKIELIDGKKLAEMIKNIKSKTEKNENRISWQ